MKHLWTAIGGSQALLDACNEIDRLCDMDPGGGEVTNRNRDFRAAQSGKKDEFYTSMKDIEAEIVHYRPHFAAKTSPGCGRSPKSSPKSGHGTTV